MVPRTRAALAALFLAALAASSSPLTPPDQAPAFPARGELVPVDVVVLEAKGRAF